MVGEETPLPPREEDMDFMIIGTIIGIGFLIVGALGDINKTLKDKLGK